MDFLLDEDIDYSLKRKFLTLVFLNNNEEKEIVIYYLMKK